MIRKSALALLASLALAVGVAGAYSHLAPLSAGFAVTDQDWVVLHFFDGRVRLFWVRSPACIDLATKDDEPHLYVIPKPNQSRKKIPE